ncbi:MAG: hypothetical protein COA80_09655 [Leeuwenhoekiella sp.]|nr:MAG: hypothetical protein COA80_09655 [Leeuwenhoekiella sp.]
MNSSRYWYLALASCILYVIVSNLDIVWGFFLKPVYALFFYLYYYSSTKKHNLVFLVFQLSALIAEIYLLTDLNKYFDHVIYFYFIATAMMLLTFVPVLKIKPQEIKNSMLIEPILGVIFCTYVIVHLITVFYYNVPNKPLFLAGAILLWVFTLICTLIPLRNRHPYNIHLYIIAAALLVECILGFLYYYSIHISLMLTTLNVAICVHKTAVSSYFVKIIQVRSDERHYL